MDVLTFTSELIKALAWPAATIFLATILRKPIIGLIPLMRKLKYKELELEFSQGVLALKAETSSAIDTPQKDHLPTPNSKALSLVPLSTRAAILEAWVDVETAAVEIASSFWSQSPNETMRNYPRLGEYLYECKVIDQKQLSTYKKLQQLRNKAAHAEELHLNEDDAKSYIAMAYNLAQHIKNTQ